MSLYQHCLRLLRQRQHIGLHDYTIKHQKHRTLRNHKTERINTTDIQESSKARQRTSFEMKSVLFGCRVFTSKLMNIRVKSIKKSWFYVYKKQGRSVTVDWTAGTSARMLC